MIKKKDLPANKKYFFPNSTYIFLTGMILTTFLLLLVFVFFLDTKTTNIRLYIIFFTILLELSFVFALRYYKKNTCITVDTSKLTFKQPLNKPFECNINDIKEAKLRYIELGTVLELYLINGSNFTIRGSYTTEQYNEIINLVKKS